MRPLELELENFRSYFGSGAVFDFRGRSLVGIVGPIGSGKSSLLDAISYALYGRTPTAGTATRSLIHQRATDGGVRFRFEVEGQVWEIVRRVRRSGASQHSLYRYDGDVASTADPIERITMEGDVNTRVEELLGLDFDAFGRSVLLAQGRFAEFLASRPGERDAVLKGVFGHDRIDVMRDVAKRRRSAKDVEVERVAARLERLDDTIARLAEDKHSLAIADERLTRLRDAAPRLDALEAAIAEAKTETERIGSRLTELDRHAARLPDSEATERLAAEAASHAERRSTVAEELSVAGEELAVAEDASAIARDSGEAAVIEKAAAISAGLAQLRKAAAEARRRLDTAARDREAAEAERTTAVDRLEKAGLAAADAASALDTAVVALAAVEEAHHQAQHDNMAQVLRAELTAGDQCPVCAQGVATVPSSRGGIDLATSENAVAEARQGRDAAEETRASAEAARSAAEQMVENAVVRVASAEAAYGRALADDGSAGEALVTARSELTDLLGEGAPEELLEERRRAAAALVDAVDAARRRLEQVRSRHEQAIRDEQGIQKRLTELRITVGDLAARLDLDDLETGEADDAETLVAAASSLRAAWERETTAARERLAAAEAARQKAVTESESLLAGLGVDGVFAAALAKAEAEAEHLRSAVERAEKEVAAAEDLVTERDRLADERDRYQRIVGDLTDARFVRFLLDDDRARLADLGSDHFARLSSGRYRFTDDGTFAIVDLTAADAVRKAASLSGGETFLASLALALALAEMVARTGGRLDAFFLDEGFGSLDPEHLDLAMEGIEALVAGDANRLVVIVSHVPELRHRLEDLIELDRHPSTGDTRIVSA